MTESWNKIIKATVNLLTLTKTFNHKNGARNTLGPLILSLLILGNIPITSGQTNNKGAGQTLEFNGSSNYVDIPGTSTLNLDGKSELTVSVWAKLKGNGTGCCDPFVAQRDIKVFSLRYDERETGHEIEFIVNNGSNWEGDGNSNGDGANCGAPRPPLNEWHFITGVLDNSELRIYIDGVLHDTESFSGTIRDTSSTETEIGGANDGYIFGAIDEVRIWDHALTKQEIRDNMTQKLQGNEPGLLAYWRLDTGSGNTAYDSANNNDGTLQ